jgi:hypothetical protein
MLHQLDWLHQLDIQYDTSTFDTDPFEPQPEGRNTIFPFWVPAPAGPRRTEDRGRSTEDRGERRTFDLRPSTFDVPPPPRPRNGYVELPYTLPQDSTLFVLLREETPEIWLRKLDWIAEHGGMALVDVHPDYMDFGAGPHRSDTI